MDGSFAILGVLLGITISGLVVVAYVGNQRSKELALVAKHAVEKVVELQDRIAAIEKRRPVVTEMTGTAGKVNVEGGKIGTGVRMRTWNENIGAVDAK